MSDIEERIYAIECKVSELGVLTKRAMDAIQTLEDCQLVRLSPKPYRMTEPTKIGASVISDGTVFTRTDNSSTPWMRLRDWQWCDWETITDPQPYQNCTLTADDPEPPVGSVVRADAGLVSERGVERWNSPWYTNAPTTWAEVADGSVTLLYRGEA